MKHLSILDWGLIVFVAVQLLNVAALLLDLWLHAHGHDTITEMVWADPVLGAPLLAVEVVGLVGLTIHFYG